MEIKKLKKIPKFVFGKIEYYITLPFNALFYLFYLLFNDVFKKNNIAIQQIFSPKRIQLKDKNILIVVSHVDDETLFAGSILLSDEPRTKSVIVIHDGGKNRNKVLEKIEEISKCKIHHLKLKEKLGPTNEAASLNEEARETFTIFLKKFLQDNKIDIIFSHNEFGEYGHGQHREVYRIVKETLRELGLDKIQLFTFGYAYPMLYVFGRTYWPKTLKAFSNISKWKKFNLKNVVPFSGIFKTKKYDEFFYFESNFYYPQLERKKLLHFINLYRNCKGGWKGWTRKWTHYYNFATNNIQYFSFEKKYDRKTITERILNNNFYYTAYSFAEEENSANQIQTKNTYENLKNINSSFRGIFLGNKKNLFWKTRKEKDKYFIDRTNYKTGIIEKYLKIGIFRKSLFPRLFAWKVGKILKRDRNMKNIYARLDNIEEGIFYLKRLDKLNIKKIVFELHNLTFTIPNFYYWNFEKKYCYKKHIEFFNLLKNNFQRAKLVTLTKSLADAIHDKFDYKEKIEVIPDAHNFLSNEPKTVNFNKEKIEIIYTGLNFKYRGVEIIIKTLEFLPDKFYFRLVGGQKQEIEEFKKRYYSFIRQNRLIMEEPVPNFKVKEKLINADIAILPTPSLGFADFTSPLKLFDYMALGMPIIASDTQVFREILTSENALFFKPQNSKDLAEKIRYLAENQKLARKIGRNAFFDSKKYTYKKRAGKICNIFNNG